MVRLKQPEQFARSCKFTALGHVQGLLTLLSSKYGSVHRQLRALTILDGLIQNAGSRFQRAFADEPLLERLRVSATDPMSDAEVKRKCGILFRQWAVSFNSTPGMERIASLYKQLPQRKKPARQDLSKVLKETEAEAEPDHVGHSVSVSGGGGALQTLSSPTSSAFSSSSVKPGTVSPGPSLTSSLKPKYDKNGKKVKSKPFNLEKEKPQLLQTIASSSVASTNLMNALKLIDRENKRVSEDAETVKRFETCKLLRRQILRYIQYVESEQWLGGLIHANEELVNALMAFEVLDKSVENDSDSESEEDEWNDDETPASSKAKTPSSRHEETQNSLAGLSLNTTKSSTKPSSRPNYIPMPSSTNGKGREDLKPNVGASDGEESDDDGDMDDANDDDPFADSNAVVSTPRVEKSGLTW